MNSDANMAVHLPIGLKANGQPYGFVEFILPISIDNL